MDRLTEKGKYGWQLKAMILVSGAVKTYNEAVKRLAAYEDTGLTPERIIEMDKLYLEKCEEVNELKKKSTPMKPKKEDLQVFRFMMNYKCPTCGGNFGGKGIAKYCYHCGQKLDWEESDGIQN